MRPDLLALTPDTLAELTNRGLVKRALKELDREPPTLTEDPDGTVHATTPDGTTTSLPGGGLAAGTCSCGAPGVCRHVVALVLAYQQSPTGPAPTASTATDPVGPTNEDSSGSTEVPSHDEPAPGWSPGDFTDEQLVARIGERALAAARRVARTGFVARVHRERPGDPVPTVELPTATVRFLVPGDLGFARTDAVAGVRDDVIALAVWAFRAADAQAPRGADVQVQVGGGESGTSGAGLDRAVALAGLVLTEGAIHLGDGLGAEVAVVERGLESARFRWPLLAVADLVGQLDAYRERSARYRPEALADQVAELFARHRAVRAGGSSLVSRVLGTDEASETPLRRARLDGLGARVSAVGEERVVDVFLAHADSATVLVLRRAYTTEEAGPRLGERRVAGVTLRALASGAVVTESASRSASRTVRLGARRLSRTEAMATRGSWDELARSLIVADLGRLATELAALPPRPIRARVEAELVRVVPVAEVLSIGYAPGAQRLDAVIAGPDGSTATITATHAACAPGRLDAVAEALSGEVRYVAGSVRRAGGGVLIDPIGFAVDAGVVVPDLAAAGGGVDPATPAGAGPDPLGQALDETLSLLSELAHRGLAHTPPTMAGRLTKAAEQLARTGLHRAAEAVRTLAGLLGPDPGDEAVTAWVDAHLRVSLTSELRP
ncbi:SWIM zinc finger family protein [Paractinoplanes ferrugineus]|uniref:SWIM-type domain-containing protein n=1 Tax=Paractinoplanes ferrugineus TaxID=113564 RepID=A0A919IZV2_9ACTN|nr:hypothetical protein [Actinoplanes ferrugineus]GIE10917.1 hypothetical protein Afe05nite_27570 [Actinoplanes ferrugineus]